MSYTRRIKLISPHYSLYKAMVWPFQGEILGSPFYSKFWQMYGNVIFSENEAYFTTRLAGLRIVLARRHVPLIFTCYGTWLNGNEQMWAGICAVNPSTPYLVATCTNKKLHCTITPILNESVCSKTTYYVVPSHGSSMRHCCLRGGGPRVLPSMLFYEFRMKILRKWNKPFFVRGSWN